MNEWGFAAEVKSWWDAEMAEHDDWGLNRCEVENQVEGQGRRRSDLVILGDGTVKLAGELRLPDHPISTPWHQDNLENAANKATARGCRWAFTSDGTQLVLMDLDRSGPYLSRVVESLDLFPFESRAELDSDRVLRAIREKWVEALGELAPLILGTAVPVGMAPDEVFIRSLRALLRRPVVSIRNALDERRQASPEFEQALVRWMVDDQNWVHDPTKWANEVWRAAQLTAYVFATRLMFYEALRRPHPQLPALELPDVNAAVATSLFKGYFDNARNVSGDYSTMFAWDRVCEYALLSEGAMPGWQRVVRHLRTYQLDRIGYDLIGRLFERLIEPAERYRWGQHYTNPDVVDLMLSFAVPNGEGAVLDPAVGGGTFLVRAYARKHVRRPDLTHQELLTELYGIDVSAFAASLATFNVAVRNLDFADNYPRVAAQSFFRVEPAHPFTRLPAPRGTTLEGEETEVAIASVSAAVFNPPYVRIQELGAERRREASDTVTTTAQRRGRGARTRTTARVPLPSEVPALSNYHVYFWLHAAQFLDDDGRLAVITAGEWLDSDYGVTLQQWLLENFAIECFIESFAEPWFSEARVGTVVCIARRCTDDEVRNANRVRFVTLRKPLRTLFGTIGDEAEHLASVDSLRDRILSLDEGSGESPELDWTVMRQDSLYSFGSQEEV